MMEVLQFLRMFAYALMFAAFGFMFILYLKNRKEWLKSFVIFLGGTSFFDLLMTFVIFQLAGGGELHPVFLILFTIFQVLFVLFMFYFSTRFLFELITGESHVKNIKPTIILTLIAWLLLGASLLFPNLRFRQIPALFIQGVLLALFFRAYTRRKYFKGGWLNGMMRKFLFISIMGYTIQCIILIFSITFIEYQNLLTFIQLAVSSTAGIVWSLLLFIEGAVVMGRKTEEAEVLPNLLLGEYKITPREQEIVIFMKKGLSSKDIGDKLFISPRTVETHMHKIYKKCAVKGRIELLHLIESYNTPE